MVSMEWSILIGVLAIAGIAAYALYAYVARTKREFVSGRPCLRITNLAVMNAGPVLTLTPELENVGRGAAHNCVLQMAGWEGSYSVKTMHPVGPGYRKHLIPIVLGPDAPLRATPLSRSYLRLSYRDRWGLIYECWYPVTQLTNVAASLYDIQIDLSRPEVTEPVPSFWAMRRFLRGHTTTD
jgi:hypothetical protein